MVALAPARPLRLSVLLVTAVVAVGAMAVGLAWQPAAVAAFDVAWTAAGACALAGLLEARASADAGGRAPWSGFALAAACWLSGQLAWDVFSVIGSPSSPNAADAGWWAFAIFVMVGLLRSPGPSTVARVVAYVEAVPLVAAAWALTWALLWPDAVHSTLPGAARLSALVYPALYVAAAVLTAHAIVVGVLRRAGGTGAVFVLGGIAAQAIAFVLWSRQLLAQDYVVGHSLIDPLWVLGLLAIGIGGAAARRRPAGAEAGHEPTERGVLLPAVLFGGLIAALVHAQFDDADFGARLMLSAGLALCGGTLTVRGVLLSRRQASLLSFERNARAALAEREAELRRLTDQLSEDSRRDALTGLRNRRSLTEDLHAVERQARRRGGSYAVALCDVDHFKAYNDRLGHLAGDDALRALAAIVRGELRAGDIAYRYGGEELLLVLADADTSEAERLAERVRAAVVAADLPHPSGVEGRLTLSIGVVAGAGPAAELLGRADERLYAAKHAGRNRVVGQTQASTEPAAPDLTPVARPQQQREPNVRQVRSLLGVSRAGDEGAIAVLDALAQFIRSELRFATVVGNLRVGQRIEAAVVVGDQDARAALLGTSTPWSEWGTMLDPRYERRGAAWLPAGAFEWSEDVHVWTPAAQAQAATDAWHPDDALLLPLRAPDGEILAVVAVDEPLNGRRPDDGTIDLLMAVAEHGAAALDQLNRRRAARTQEQLAAVLLLAERLDLRDPTTARHSATVADYAHVIARRLGLAPERCDRVRIAGALHDVGKLAIPDAILHKPGALDDAEWREIRRHPEIGARICAGAGLTDVAEWVHAHHERLDGRGYPRRRSAREIPLEARILAVADAYEAMIADRPYRAGMAPEHALAELRAGGGAQFDPAVVDAFVGYLEQPEADPVGGLPTAAVAI
jgi:diguanylate cyclase (GGDEF)-like protein